MSRIFLSHSSHDNGAAIGLHSWLRDEGWDDVFLDVNPDRGIAAGERWERALNAAANRCEAVLFLASASWLASPGCMKEFNLAHRLNKRLISLLIEDIAVADLPVTLTGTWQVVCLGAGRDHVMLRAVMPVTGDEVHVTFSTEGLARLRTRLQRAGLDPRFFPGLRSASRIGRLIPACARWSETTPASSSGVKGRSWLRWISCVAWPQVPPLV